MINTNGWLIAATALGLVVVFAAVNIGVTAANAINIARHWTAELREPAVPNAIRLVALGDSTVQSIGASSPMEGYVGRIATYVQQRTGRPVHIENVATGGPITDILSKQVPQVDLPTADIVVLADDNLNGMSLVQYRATLESLAAVLPADRTVVSDLPGLPGEARYQPVLSEVMDAHGILRADVQAILSGDGRRLDVFSWLPPHMNSKGYGYWFKAFKPKIDVILERNVARLGAAI